MFVRLPTVGEGLADAEAPRDTPDPAINLYTEEVIYGLVGSYAPVAFLKDPIPFSDFIHSPEARFAPRGEWAPSRVRSLVTPISHRTHRPRPLSTHPDEGCSPADAGGTRIAAACAPVRW